MRLQSFMIKAPRPLIPQRSKVKLPPEHRQNLTIQFHSNPSAAFQGFFFFASNQAGRRVVHEEAGSPTWEDSSVTQRSRGARTEGESHHTLLVISERFTDGAAGGEVNTPSDSAGKLLLSSPLQRWQSAARTPPSLLMNQRGK